MSTGCVSTAITIHPGHTRVMGVGVKGRATDATTAGTTIRHHQRTLMKDERTNAELAAEARKVAGLYRSVGHRYGIERNLELLAQRLDEVTEELRVSENYRRIYQSRANERAEELNVIGDMNASLKEQLAEKVPEEFHTLWKRIANQRRSLRVLHRWNEMLNKWYDQQALQLRAANEELYRLKGEKKP